MNQKHTIALIKDTLGHTMKRVIKELGCPMLPMQLLTDEQSAYLRSEIEELPSDSGELNRLLSKSTLSGKVVQVGSTPDGFSLFTVQVPLKHAVCLLTMEFYRDEWKLYKIDSVRTRRKQIRQSLVGALAGAVLTAAICLIAWGFGAAHDPVAEVKSEGYIVLTKAQYQEQVPATAGQPTKKSGDASTTTAGNGGTDGNSSSVSGSSSDGSGAADQGQQVTFTMQQGMTTNDLTTWLKNNGLIQDQAKFNQELTQQGIDTKIRPKDYVFKKGMSEQDILNVLQK